MIEYYVLLTFQSSYFIAILIFFCCIFGNSFAGPFHAFHDLPLQLILLPFVRAGRKEWV